MHTRPQNRLLLACIVGTLPSLATPSHVVAAPQYISTDREVANWRASFASHYAALGRPKIRILAPSDATATSIADEMAALLRAEGAEVTIGAVAAQDALRADRSLHKEGKRSSLVSELDSLPSITEPLVLVLDFERGQIVGIDRWHRYEAFAATLRRPTSNLSREEVRINAAQALGAAVKTWHDPPSPDHLMAVWLDVPSAGEADRLRIALAEGAESDVRCIPSDDSEEVVEGASKWTRLAIEVRFPASFAPAKVRQMLRQRCEQAADVKRSIAYSSTSDYLSIGRLVPFAPEPRWYALTGEAGTSATQERAAFFSRAGARNEVLIAQTSRVADPALVNGLSNGLRDAGFKPLATEVLDGVAPDSTPTENATLAAQRFAGRSAFVVLIDRQPAARGSDPNGAHETAYDVRLIDPDTAELLASEVWPAADPASMGNYDPRRADIGAARFLLGRLLEDFDRQVIIEQRPRSLSVTIADVDGSDARAAQEAMKTSIAGLVVANYAFQNRTASFRIQFPRTLSVNDLMTRLEEALPGFEVTEQVVSRVSFAPKAGRQATR